MNVELKRRAFLGYFSTIGLSGTLFPGVLWSKVAQQQAPRVTREMIAQAEKVAGLEFSDAERDEMIRGLDQNLTSWAQLRAIPVPNAVSPALLFDPVPVGVKPATVRKPMRMSLPRKLERPVNLEEIAFWPVRDLAE